MEWNEKLQLIIDYVEAHLQRTEQPIVLQGIAGFCFCSQKKLPGRKPIQKPIPIDF